MTNDRTTTRPRRRLVVWREQTLSSGHDLVLELSSKHGAISGSPDPSVCFVATSGRRVTLDGPGQCRSRESCPNAEEPVADLL